MAGGDSPAGTLPDTTPVGDDGSPSDTSLKSATQPAPSSPHPSPQVALEAACREEVKLVLDGFTLHEATLVNSPLLPYLAMVATLVEGRTIRRRELVGVLLRSMRQRSFDSLPRREYVLACLNQHPP